MQRPKYILCHEIVEFRILRGESRTKSKLTTLELRITYFGLSIHWKDPMDKALDGRDAQENWLMFKDYHLQAQNGPS